MSRYLCYLAGPITGCQYGECVDWREWFRKNLPACVEGLSPMRGKTYLKNLGAIKHQEYEDWVLCRDDAIMARDYFDCQRADVVVVNLLGAQRVSIGTVMEIAWCYQKHTPMVFIAEKGNVHDHPMIRACGGFQVETVEEALHVVKAILDTEAMGTQSDEPEHRVRSQSERTAEGLRADLVRRVFGDWGVEFIMRTAFISALAKSAKITDVQAGELARSLMADGLLCYSEARGAFHLPNPSEE